MSNKLKNKYVVAKLTSKLYLDDEFADFYFTFHSEKVPVHKIILASGSPVFRAMFYGGVNDKNSVEIFDSNFNAFKVFLQFFYLDEVALAMEHIEEVVKLADKYDMLDCVNSCVKYLVSQFTVDNIIWCYQLAIYLNNQMLEKFCKKYIANNSKNVIKSDGFRRCDQKTLKSILKMDETMCDESEVYEACISWAKNAAQQNGMDENNAENLRNQLGDCLYFIRFAAMTIDEFALCTKFHKGLFTRDELEDIMYATAKACVKPTIFCQEPRISLDLSRWNSSPTLSCEKSNDVWAEACEISLKLQFSVNVPVLLGEITCTPTVARSFVSMKILEIDDQSKNENPDENVIFARNFETEERAWTGIPLPSALIIQPHNIYEFRIENQGAGKICSDGEEWQAEYQLDEQLVIKFLNEKHSLIGHLSFKRI